MKEQKKLLQYYLDGKGDIFPTPSKATIAKTVYDEWAKELSGRLVEEEYEVKANISALVYLDKDDEAKKIAKALTGVDTYAVSLIAEDAKQPLSTDKYFQPLLP